MKLLALLAVVAVAGCGGSSSAKHEADRAKANQEAHAEIEPEEALLGPTVSREREQGIAEALYKAEVDSE